MPKKLTTEEFIKRSKTIHGNKYDYSLVNFDGIYKKIKIICPEHGMFEQIPKSHLKGYECSKCGHLKTNKKHTLNNKKFIKKAKEIHGDKYDYSLVEYKSAKTKVKIICQLHGIFEQTPTNHTHKTNPAGCSFCFGTKKLTTEEFIKKAKEIHGDKYDYSLVKYKKNNKKIKIICKKHGIFEQQPNNHISGNGCPLCKLSKGELKIINYLDNKKIYFIYQKKFKKCKNKNILPFDFYLPDYNLCIEFDGKQHFESNEFFGGIKSFEKLKYNDNIKTEYCKNNNISLIRIKYNENIIEKLESYL